MKHFKQRKRGHASRFAPVCPEHLAELEHSIDTGETRIRFYGVESNRQRTYNLDCDGLIVKGLTHSDGAFLPMKDIRIVNGLLAVLDNFKPEDYLDEAVSPTTAD